MAGVLLPHTVPSQVLISGNFVYYYVCPNSDCLFPTSPEVLELPPFCSIAFIATELSPYGARFLQTRLNVGVEIPRIVLEHLDVEALAGILSLLDEACLEWPLETADACPAALALSHGVRQRDAAFNIKVIVSHSSPTLNCLGRKEFVLLTGEGRTSTYRPL